jgi:type III pantothenate kinase
MLLAIDIGNTNINLGIFSGRSLVKRFSIPTRSKKYVRPLKKIFRRQKIDDVVISSVVPASQRILEKDLKKLLGRHLDIQGKDIKIPIKNLYRNPEKVGQDRLVNAYAGVVFYGAPLIIVDFGTAITFDVVSRDKEYMGGMVLPGLNISLEALAEKTALLPKIKLGKPKRFIGSDTETSMLSGLVFGFAALTDSFIRQLKKEIGKKALAIGTGGDIGLISGFCREFDRIDKDLTLKGLNLIYHNTG